MDGHIRAENTTVIVQDGHRYVNESVLLQSQRQYLIYEALTPFPLAGTCTSTVCLHKFRQVRMIVQAVPLLGLAVTPAVITLTLTPFVISGLGTTDLRGM